MGGGGPRTAQMGHIVPYQPPTSQREHAGNGQQVTPNPVQWRKINFRQEGQKKKKHNNTQLSRDRDLTTLKRVNHQTKKKKTILQCEFLDGWKHSGTGVEEIRGAFKTLIAQFPVVGTANHYSDSCPMEEDYGNVRINTLDVLFFGRLQLYFSQGY